MQKNASTILIAFLAGLVVAGGSLYIVTSLRNKPAVQQASVQTAQPAQAPAAQPAAPDAQPAPAPAVEQPAPAARTPSRQIIERPIVVQRKPRPSVERQSAEKRPAKQDENSAAPQPTQAEVAQVTAPTAPPPAEVPPQPAAPAQPGQALYPPPGTQTAPPPVREPKTITLAAGTPIAIRVNETISTDTNYAGDTFTASLDKPIVVDGFVIADRGARVTGKVVEAQKAGRVKGLSHLALTVTQIHTTDGQTINVDTSPWNKDGDNSKKRDAAEMAGGAALGAIIGAIAGGGRGAAIGAGAGGAAGTGAVMTTRGKPAIIPSETRITFSLNSSVPITERLN